MDPGTLQMLTIGKVAKAAGLGVETVRFYERQGLIAEPARSSSGYRKYRAETIKRLQFIVRAKALGFTLQEIGDLLDLRATPGAGCADVQARAEAKIADIEERIAQLDAMKRALGDLVAQCRGEGPLSDCPILDALDEDEP
jgi:MerR family transcriptional regulator, copper efflux regulator